MNARERKLDVGGLLLGPKSEVQYRRGYVHLSPGDCLALYSDGIVEGENPRGDQFGEERLVDVIVENRSLAAEELVPKVFKEVEEFCGDKRREDDMTLVVVKRLP